MHPIICTIGPFSIYSYGLMLVLAFIACASLAAKEAGRRKFIFPELIFNFCFIIFISGIIGARIFFIVENIGYYLRDPLEIIMLQHGGLSWYGGLFLGSVSGVFYLRKKKIPVYGMLDLMAPYLALGQAIGRIGCFLNGCCFGSGPIPAQLVSSFLLLVIFITLRIIQQKGLLPGAVFFSYLLFYSVKRFFMEFLRVDNPEVFFSLTLFQLISIALFILSSAALIRINKPGK